MYLEECGIEYEEDDCECTYGYNHCSSFSFQNEAYEEWEEEHEGLAEWLELEQYAIHGLGLAVGTNDDEIISVMQVLHKDGKVPFASHVITEDMDSFERRAMAEMNYDIYISLMFKLFGGEAFKDLKKISSFETYLGWLQTVINEKFADKEFCMDSAELVYESCMRDGQQMYGCRNNSGCEICENAECKYVQERIKKQ